ncbi:MAG: type II toxin-antitoxin system prevent-host-death family antitoxin [Caldilineaceae bacterium]
MDTVPQIVPISDLRIRHNDVLEMLKNGPVILAQRSRPAAVLVSVEAWDDQAEYIDNLECAVAALKVELAIAKGEDELVEFTPDELALDDIADNEEDGSSNALPHQAEETHALPLAT